MTTRIVTTGVDFADLRGPWTRLHELVGGTVFQSYAWLKTWWDTFGDLFALRLFTAWDGNQLIGVVPCFVLRQSFPPFRSLRFLGEYSTFGEYLPLIAQDREDEVTPEAAAFLRQVLLSREVHCIDFHHFPSQSRSMQLMISQLERASVNVRFTPQSLPRVFMRGVPQTVDEYHRLLSYNQRGVLRRRERAIAKRGAGIEILTRGDVPGAYDDIVRLHTTVWSLKGKPGLFRGRDRFEQFHRALLERLAGDDQTRLYFYSQSGYRFCGLLVFRTHGTWCLYLNGRDPRHPLSHLSPGSVLMSRAICDAIQDGASAIDMLEGLHQYKLRLGGHLEWYSRATAHLPGIRGARGRIFAGVVRRRDARRVRERQSVTADAGPFSPDPES